MSGSGARQGMIPSVFFAATLLLQKEGAQNHRLEAVAGGFSDTVEVRVLFAAPSNPFKITYLRQKLRVILCCYVAATRISLAELRPPARPLLRRTGSRSTPHPPFAPQPTGTEGA